MPPKKKLYGKPPVRLMLTDVAGEDAVATLAPHSTVYVPKNGHKAEHAFEWSSKFFVVVANFLQKVTIYGNLTMTGSQNLTLYIKKIAPTLTLEQSPQTTSF